MKNKLKMTIISGALVLVTGVVTVPQQVQAQPTIEATVAWLNDFVKGQGKGTCNLDANSTFSFRYNSHKKYLTIIETYDAYGGETGHSYHDIPLRYISNVEQDTAISNITCYEITIRTAGEKIEYDNTYAGESMTHFMTLEFTSKSDNKRVAEKFKLLQKLGRN